MKPLYWICWDRTLSVKREITKSHMLLVFPPAAKPGEPPAGIARLAGALKAHGIGAKCVDLNIESLHWLLEKDAAPSDKWSERALKKKRSNLEILTSRKGYTNLDRYRNAVLDTNRALKEISAPFGAVASLANYKSESLSPVKSRDLMEAAERFDESLYFPFFEKRFAELEMELGGFSVIGLSMNFLNQALPTFALAGFLRNRYPEVHIVLGGGLITSWMRMPNWENPFGDLFDTRIAAEGEVPILELFGKKTCWQFHLPDYSDFMEYAYLAPGFTLPFNASGGCYWQKCTFCPERAEKSVYRPAPDVMAVEQLHELNALYRPELVHIVDNAIGPAFMGKLAKSGFRTPWYAFARVTQQLADPDYCKALSASGCRMLKLGIESGDPEVLKAMNKGVTLGLVSKVLSTLKAAGIATYVYLLFGTPTEGEIAARRTMEFVIDHAGEIGFLNLSVFNLPYFAPEVKELDTTAFYDGDLSLYADFNHPEGWHRGRIRQFLDKEFKRHPKIARIVTRDPPVFNSNHAAFFC